MNSITELRDKINEMIKSSTVKEQIDSLSGLNKLVDNIEADTKALVDKNAELLDDYKNAVLSSGFKEKPNTEKEITGEEQGPISLEDIAMKIVNAK